MPFTSSSSPVTPSMKYTAASSKTPWATADARGIPSTKSGFFCTPRATSSPHVNKNDSERPSRQMRHTSVWKSSTFTGQVREVFHQDTPTQGRRLAAHLIEPPTSLPHPRNRPTGPDPTQMEGRTRRLLRHSRSQQRTPPKPSTDIIELGRRTARGYRNPTNYQPRMPLTTAGLDASTHTQL